MRKKPFAMISTDKGELGIRSLSASLRQNDDMTCLFFLNKGEDGELEYTGEELEQIARKLVEYAPVGIGFSHYQISEKRFWQLERHLRRVPQLFDVPFVVGGQQVSANSKKYLEEDPRLICVRGEGEVTLIELLLWAKGRKELADIEGLVYRERGGAYCETAPRTPIANLDALPPVDFDLDPRRGTHFTLTKGRLEPITANFIRPIGNVYIDLLGKDRPGNPLFVMTRRGCGYGCSYCVFGHQKKDPYYLKSRAVRTKDLQLVVEEVSQLKQKWPALDVVIFFDSDFLGQRNVAELETFSRAWAQACGLPIFIYADPRTITKEKMNALIHPGDLRVTLNIGFQSGSYRMLKEVYTRDTKPDKLIEVATFLHEDFVKTGLLDNAPWYDFIIDNPKETTDDILASINLIRRIPGPAVLHIHNLVLYDTSPLLAELAHVMDPGRASHELQDQKYHARRAAKKRLDEGAFFSNVLRVMTGPMKGGRFGYVAISDRELQEFLQYRECGPAKREALWQQVEALLERQAEHPCFYYGQRGASSISIQEARAYLTKRGVWDLASAMSG